MGLLSWCLGLVDRIALGPVDPAGPGGAFSRTVHAALGYQPVEAVVDPDQRDAGAARAAGLRPAVPSVLDLSRAAILREDRGDAQPLIQRIRSRIAA